MMPIRTLVHPTDFSPCSARAFELACELARDSGARLVTLHVKPPAPRDPAAEEDLSSLEDPESETFVEDVELGHDLRAFTRSDPCLRIEKRVETGDPASEILRVADEVSADLIVMGTHGTAESSRALLGSVACRVLNGAHCAIITVALPTNTGQSAAPSPGRPAELSAAPLPPRDRLPEWAEHPAA